MVSVVLDQGDPEAGRQVMGSETTTFSMQEAGGFSGLPPRGSRRKPSRWMALVESNGQVYTLEKYHKSMVDGLMVYGMMRAVKK